MIRSGYFNGGVYNLLHAFVLPSARLFDYRVLDSLQHESSLSVTTKDRCGEEIETKMGKLTEEQNNGDIKAFLKGYDRILATGAIGLRHDYLKEVKTSRVVSSTIFSWMFKRQSGNHSDGLCTPRDVAVIYRMSCLLNFIMSICSIYERRQNTGRSV